MRAVWTRRVSTAFVARPSTRTRTVPAPGGTRCATTRNDDPIVGAPASETSSFGTSRTHTGAERVPANAAVKGPGRVIRIRTRYAPGPVLRARLPAIVIPPGRVGVTRARSVATSPKLQWTVAPSAHVAVSETASGAGPRARDAASEQSAACAGEAVARAA